MGGQTRPLGPRHRPHRDALDRPRAAVGLVGARDAVRQDHHARVRAHRRGQHRGDRETADSATSSSRSTSSAPSRAGSGATAGGVASSARRVSNPRHARPRRPPSPAHGSCSRWPRARPRVGRVPALSAVPPRSSECRRQAAPAPVAAAASSARQRCSMRCSRATGSRSPCPSSKPGRQLAPGETLQDRRGRARRRTPATTSCRSARRSRCTATTSTTCWSSRCGARARCSSATQSSRSPPPRSSTCRAAPCTRCDPRRAPIVGYAVFVPPFDGKDRVPVEAPLPRCAEAS